MSVKSLEAAPPRPAALAGVALPALALLALCVVIYHRTATTFWTTWTTNDNYSHGPLVPLVSLVLAWRVRRRLRELPIRPDARGLLLVGLACAIHVLGIRADLFALQGYSMLCLLFGLSLTFLGVAHTRVLAFPLGYLVFMLIFPPIVMNRLSYALKEITVRASTHVAEALGATLQRSGMTLYLESGELRIENPCSGLRSLLALLATGALFAYLQPGGWLRRSMLLLAAVPIAMLSNAVRTTVLILVAHYVGVRQVSGVFHDFTGYLVYAVALVGLFTVRALLMPRAPAGDAGRGAPAAGATV